MAIASGEMYPLPLIGKSTRSRSTSSVAEDRSVDRAENWIPNKESLLSRGMNPPKPPKNTSVLTCAHVTLPCSMLRVRDVRTGNGRCIVFRHFLSLDWVSPQRLIPTMRARSSSAPMMSPPASFWKFASMKMGKAGQISNAVFTSVLDLHTSCKLRWPACSKTIFLHLSYVYQLMPRPRTVSLLIFAPI